MVTRYTSSMKLGLLIAILLCSCRFTLSQENGSDQPDDLNSIEHRLKVWENFFDKNFFELGIDPRSVKGSGFKHYIGAKFYFEMNKNSDGNIMESRWDLFKKSRVSSFISSSMSSAFLPAANWQSLGPNSIDSMGGRMMSHAFDPVDPDILWAGSSTGGIWRSTNGAESWESMTDELPSMSISDIEINPVNRDIMLAGTGADRFVSYTLQPGVGVLKSTDRGLTWNTTGYNYPISQAVSVSKIIWHPAGNDTIYMAASNGFWRSENAGDNWSLRLPGRASSIAINKQSPNILYTIIRGNGVFKSTNSGNNWTLLTNGLPIGGSIGLSAISICDAQPEILYVTISNSSTFALTGFYKTTDGGDSWTQISNAPNVSCQPNVPTSCQGWFVNMCGVSPTDPNLVFLGGVQFWRSSNGGATWTWHDFFANGSLVNNRGEVYVDQWDIGFHPTNPDIIYQFNDGGVQKSTNGGLWWNKKNKDLVTGQLYRVASSPSDTTFLIGGFQDHGLQLVDNTGGNTMWLRWSASDGANVIVHPTNNNILYGDFLLGFHNRSTTGGTSWPQTTVPINSGITEVGEFIAPLIMHPDNPNILFTASLNKIYKTTNAGIPWFPVSNIPNVNTLAFDAVDHDIIYGHRYNFANWTFVKSTDGGASWDSITNNTIPTFRVLDLEADPSNSGIVYAVRNSALANQDHIKMSTDFAETWTNITNDLPDIPVYSIAISPFNPTHLYVATDFGVYASTNRGANWMEFNDGLPIVPVYDIHYHPMDKTLRVATLGRGVYKTKAIDGSVSIHNQNEIAKTFELFQNYPNPFNGGTVIKYDLKKDSDVKLTIYNSSAQRVAELFNGRQTAGSHSISWDAKNSLGMDLPSGVYFLKIIAGGFSKSIKLTYVK